MGRLDPLGRAFSTWFALAASVALFKPLDS